jgi:hypothetical protein
MSLNKAEEIARVMRNTLTVRELIDQLSELPEDAKVLFTCDYGDHCHTKQALGISECRELYPDTEELEDSRYSQSGVAVRDKGEEWPDEAEEVAEVEGERVVLLS